jgi:hypothetical protein
MQSQKPCPSSWEYAHCPLSAPPSNLDQRGVLPEVVRKAAGLHVAELQLSIEDREKLAEVQRIVPVPVEFLDDLLKLMWHGRHLSLPLQLRKFATAQQLIARSVKPGEMLSKAEGVIRCQTKPFVMHKFGLSFIISTQESEEIDLPQI